METGGLSPEVGAAIRKYLDRADVVLLTQLRSKASGKVVTIGNIHVVWDFMRSPDVQCIQVATVRSQKSSTVLFVFVNYYKKCVLLLLTFCLKSTTNASLPVQLDVCWSDVSWFFFFFFSSTVIAILR